MNQLIEKSYVVTIKNEEKSYVLTDKNENV